MIREALAGLGIVAYGDPMPGPGVRGGMSYTPSASTLGRIRLVSSRGVRREATYQMIYESNPFVYAATNYIARGIGRLPLHIIELDASGEKRRIRADLPGVLPPQSRVDRLLNMPAGRMSRAAFYTGTMRQRLVLGNALWELDRPAGGFPSGMRRVPWQHVVHVEEDGYGNAKWYEIQEPGPSRNRRRLLANDVVHFGLGSEGGESACGCSLLESCSATLALHDALLRHVLAYFENSARPSGHLHLEKATKDKVAEIRELLNALYASPENAGQILVTSGKWEKTGDSPDQSAIVELLKQSRIEIAAAWQVPPPILGLLENAIRANVKELREQFGRDTIGPWATETEDELEAQLVKPDYPSLQCEFQLAEQLRPDLEARALVYQRLMWVMSIDEIRQTENLPPLKLKGVTDVPWVASGAMPVTNAAKNQPRSSTATPPAGPGAEEDGPVLTLEQAAEVIRLTELVASNGNNHDH